MAGRRVTFEDLRYCTCAGCGLDMLGGSPANRHVARALGVGLPSEFIRGRILGRPYCEGCLTSRPPPQSAATADEGASPWQENAIRAMEDVGG